MNKGKYDYSIILDEAMVSDGQTSHTKILQQVHPGTSVLECGSGDGIMTRYLKETLGCSVYIIEIDQESFDYTKKFADAGVCADLEQDAWMSELGDASFDYILYADVLEHLRDPLSVLIKMQRFLKPHGCVLLSVPNIANGDVIMNLLCDRFTYTPMGLLDNTHLHFFARHDLRDMIRAAGYYLASESCTRVPLFASEQGVFVPQILRNALKQAMEVHPTSYVYQYICRLSLEETATESDVEESWDAHQALPKARFYFDQGKGYSDTNGTDVIAEVLPEGLLSYKVELPESCIAVRFDPVEGQECLVSDLKITGNDGAIPLAWTNGTKIGNSWFFGSSDPQIGIEIQKGRMPEVLTVSAIITFVNRYELENLACNLNKSLRERDEAIEALNVIIAQFQEFQRSYEMLEKKSRADVLDLQLAHESLRERDAEIEALNVIKAQFQELQRSYEMLEKKSRADALDLQLAHEQLKISQNELMETMEEKQIYVHRLEELTKEHATVKEALTSVTNSHIWRVTKPLRTGADFMKRLIKSNRFIYFTYRGLKCLKENGFKYTSRHIGQKINTYKQKKTTGNINTDIGFALPTCSNDEARLQRERVFDNNISFSIVVPLYNTNERFLKELVTSVTSQTYTAWELCFADGSNPGYSSTQKLCTEYCKKDKRIKYVRLKENMGIANNTIAAYSLATGKYIVLMDHDDLLTDNALYEAAECISQYPDVDFIYSDRGIFSDETNRLLAYHYLPGYSPEFLRACNYASHLNIFSKHIINVVGFVRPGYDGSQDYDFELRVVEKARAIHHIPKVLYYCRAGEGSVALDPTNKMYAYEAGKLAIQEHIERIGYPGKVEFLPTTFSYRIHYDIIKPGKVTIVIPNADHVDLLKKCVESILAKTDYEDYDIIILENNSNNDETFAYYTSLKANNRIRVITYPFETCEFNYAALNNYAIKQTDATYILFMNNDVEVINYGWMKEMLMFAQRDDVGAVGAKLYYPDGTIQHSGLFIGLGGHIASSYDHGKNGKQTGYMHRLSMPQNYNAVTAACMMVKKADFMKVDGFDEINFKVGLNDIDLCLKLRSLGLVNVVTPYAELFHYESASRGSDNVGLSKKRFEGEQHVFRSKWHSLFEMNDEYYNERITW